MLLFWQASQFFFRVLRDWKEEYWQKTHKQICVYALFDVNKKGNTKNIFIELFPWDAHPTFRPGECWEKAVLIIKAVHRILSSNEQQKNWVCLLLTDWACVFFYLQQSDIGIIPLMPLTWFLTYTLVPGLSKSGHLYIIKLHVVLGGIFIVMQRKELTRHRDHNIIWVLDVVPHKFILTQCSNCRVYCQQVQHLFSASAFL